jgi:hypothetical protein
MTILFQATYPANFLLKPVPHTIFDIQLVNADGRPLESSRYDAHYEKTQLEVRLYPRSILGTVVVLIVW